MACPSYKAVGQLALGSWAQLSADVLLSLSKASPEQETPPVIGDSLAELLALPARRASSTTG